MLHTTALQHLWNTLFHSFSASRRARTLTSTQKRRDETRGHPEITLLSALGEEGCPICRVSSGHDKSYFFWFLHESYSQLEIAEQLSHSIGFCLAHGLHLAEMESASSQIVSIHETFSRHLNALASNRKNRKSWINIIATRQGILERCPACRSFDGVVRRSAFFLAGMIDYPDVISRYANPGILCLPHLQMVAREVDDASFQRLLRLHAKVVSSALDAANDTWRESEGSLDRCEQHLLHLAVGHDRGPGTYRLTEREGLVPTIDPAGRAGANIWKLDACPVCIEMRRAWFEWIDWLDTACRGGDSVEDMLPACPDHIWAGVHFGGPTLALATARASAKTALWLIQTALRQIDDPSPPRPRSSFTSLLVDRQPANMLVGRARAILGRPITCPVCRRLESARDRTLLLPFAMLEEHTQRTEFEASYGLCLKHFARALGLGPKPAIAEFIVDVQLAKLSRLEWELTEYLRKQAWSARPEKKDEEQRAPVRAIHRFSGFARPSVDDPAMRVECAPSQGPGTASQPSGADQRPNRLVG